jgi:hypothetical protein
MAEHKPMTREQMLGLVAEVKRLYDRTQAHAENGDDVGVISVAQSMAVNSIDLARAVEVLIADDERLVLWSTIVRDSLVGVAEAFAEDANRLNGEMAEVCAHLVSILCHQAHALDKGFGVFGQSAAELAARKGREGKR